MSEQNNKTSTKSFLNSLYKNVKMGADAIIDLMPKVANEKMREEMTCELEHYEKFAKEIRAMLFDLGEEPKEESFMTKLMAKMGLSINTMMDTTTSHIADIMIQGATMGITETTKLIREFESTACCEKALDLAKEIVEYEQESIEKLKKFL